MFPSTMMKTFSLGRQYSARSGLMYLHWVVATSLPLSSDLKSSSGFKNRNRDAGAYRERGTRLRRRSNVRQSSIPSFDRSKTEQRRRKKRACSAAVLSRFADGDATIPSIFYAKSSKNGQFFHCSIPSALWTALELPPICMRVMKTEIHPRKELPT